MKNSRLLIAFVLLIPLLFACSNTNDKGMEPDNYSGNSETYTLYQASEYNVNGTVTFKELKTGFTEVEINVTPTEKGLLHPGHIHFLSIDANGDIAAVLNPIDGEIGKSITIINEFEDGSSINYQDFIQLDACIKVHLSSTPPDYHTILVGGNIAAAQSKENPFGRLEITVCK